MKFKVCVTEKNFGYAIIEADSKEEAEVLGLDVYNEGGFSWTGSSLSEFSADKSMKDKTKPIVEGTVEDTGFKGTGYCDELCGHCNCETFNIPTSRVSLCATCQAEIFPCAACDSNCDWCNETHSCHKFTHTDEWVEEMNKETFRVGTKVLVNEYGDTSTNMGTVVGRATDDFPSSTNHYIIDYGDGGTRTVHNKVMIRIY